MPDAGRRRSRLSAPAEPREDQPVRLVEFGRPGHDPEPASHLPIAPTPLIGRAQDIAAVAAMLRDADGRLVTLVGPGGVGKTRLALEIARSTAGEIAAGAAAVPLAAIREPALVLPAIARALDVQEDVGRPLAEALGDTLRCREMLLVLDNLEQVLTAAPAIADLLERCQRLRVLATSRAPLRVRAERTFPVEPLALPDPGADSQPNQIVAAPAVVLFVDRARAVRAGFEITSSNAAAVAEVCRRLDGIPLGIELAAARTKVLPPQALLDRLGDRFALLTGGPRDLPERQRTMRAAIAWSYDLLATDEQALLRGLAVFEGGFDLDVAEAVGGLLGGEGEEGRPPSSPSPLDALATLVDTSLVEQEIGADGGPRFVTLETIRAFGLEQLTAQGEEDRARAAHAAFFLDLAKRMEPDWYGPGFAACLARVSPEQANLRAAIGWLERSGSADAALELAAALVFFWFYHGPVGEGRVWLERLLAKSDPRPSVARAKALEWAANLAGKQGEADRAAALAAEAVNIARASGDRQSLGLALCTLGAFLRQQGSPGETGPLFEEALALFRALGLGEFTALPLLNLGLLAYDAGDDARARALLTEALGLRLRAGNEAGAAIVRHAIADLSRERGDRAEAAARYRENLTVYRSLRDASGIADSLTGMALSLAAGAGPERAVRVLAAAAAVRDGLGATVHASLRKDDDAFLARARTEMGEAAFALTWAAGTGLPLDQAVAEADAALVRVPRSPAPVVDQAPTPPSPGGEHGLTRREVEVLRLIASGMTDRQIGEALFVSHATARTHVGRVLSKLGLSTRAAAAAYAHRHGLA